MDRATINSIGILILGAALSFMAAWFWGRKREREARDERIVALETQVAIITAQAAPVNAVFQSILIKQLTHFHTPTMDALMVKLGDVDTPPTITPTEEKQLIVALKKRAQDMGPLISDEEREAAELLPLVMKRVKREAEAVASGAKFANVKVVGLLPEGEDSKAEK